MDAIELLRLLTEAFGPSGFEDEVRDVIRELIDPLVDETRVDTLGNLIATRKGRSETTLMLDAHMDEIGFMITWIEDDGFLRFAPIGGWDERIVPAHQITIRTDSGAVVKGAIGATPPHVLRPAERDKPLKFDDLFIDIGATSRQEVVDIGIRVGSPAVIAYPFEQLNSGTVMAKALDDRAGCAALIRTLDALHDDDLDVTVVANFAVQEEVGLRGAQTAAFQIDPDIAIALEGTVAADIPGVPPRSSPTRTAKGPSVRVMDSGMIASPKLVRVMVDIAEQAGIPYQYQATTRGGTDAGIIHRTRGGVLSGVVSVPCRYIHSPVSVMRLDDFENTAKLVTEVVRHGPGMLR